MLGAPAGVKVVEFRGDAARVRVGLAKNNRLLVRIAITSGEQFFEEMGGESLRALDKDNGRIETRRRVGLGDRIGREFLARQGVRDFLVQHVSAEDAANALRQRLIVVK